MALPLFHSVTTPSATDTVQSKHINVMCFDCTVTVLSPHPLLSLYINVMYLYCTVTVLSLHPLLAMYINVM